jgi:hypothetical protein
MNILRLVLLILALLLFGLAAVGVASPRGNLMAAGLFCFVLAELVRNP